MHISSHTVKPELFDSEQKEILLNYITTVKKIIKEKEYIKIRTDINDFYLTIYKNGIVRFTTYNIKIGLNSSFSIEALEKAEDYKLKVEDSYSKIVYKNILIEIQYSPFRITIFKDNKIKYRQKAVAFNNTKSYLFIDRSPEAFIYGLGEKTGFLNKNNEKTIMWNSDVFEPHTQSNKELYQSINMFSYFSKEQKYGLFLDNASKSIFDFETYEDESVIITDIGELDYYIYTGNSLKEIVIQNAELTGKTYLAPLWASGYHQSRHSYKSTEELLEIYSNFKKKGIPVDAIYLDILYMEKYKVFTFDDKRFYGIKDALEKLKRDGVEIVPIVDPGVKVENGYTIYENGIKNDFFCKYPDGKIYSGNVWPGKSVFYDFINKKIDRKSVV